MGEMRSVIDSREGGRVWKQTITGRAFPLEGFGPADVDLFGDVAESLARTCRYGGHVPGNIYSVAQHCVVMADVALDETGDATLAAHCLLHDAHEAYFGDMTTPVAHWLDVIATRLGARPGTVAQAIGVAKSTLDAAIWLAAGMGPPNGPQHRAIRDYDIRMLATERRQLLMPPPKSWGAEVETARPIRLRGRLTAWPIANAAEQWRARLATLCPNARRV